MPKPHRQQSTNRLESLARARFNLLSEAERRLLTAAPRGSMAVCTEIGKTYSSADDLKNAEEWAPKRHVRSELIRWLCVSREAQNLVDPRGIIVYGAKIVAPLDLSFAVVPFPLSLLGCYLDSPLSLTDAEMPMLNLQGTRVTGISGDRFVTKGSVFLRRGFQAHGEVRFTEAQIQGDFDCTRGKLRNTGQPGTGIALQADGVVVRGSVFLSDDFESEGEIRFTGAQITGDMVLEHGSFTGGVGLTNAQIGGSFACDGAILNGSCDTTNRAGYALIAGGLSVKGQVLMRAGFRSRGCVQLQTSQLQYLDCSGGLFENPPRSGVENTGCALDANGAIVAGAIHMRSGFCARGSVRLLEARIGSELDFTGGLIENPTIAGIEGSGAALDADGIIIGNTVFLRNGFHSKGALRLIGAQIGGDLVCSNALLEGAMLADRAIIRGEFVWELTSPAPGPLWLTNASADTIADSRNSWPPKAFLRLDGFVYRQIAEGPTDATSRLDWLSRCDKFSPQPYRQLAKVLESSGDDDGATEVLVEMERLQRTHKLTSFLLRWTIGYGYHPLRVLWGMGVVASLGWIVYRRAFLAGTIIPTKKDAYSSLRLGRSLPGYYPEFAPFIYSVENSPPLVRLGQADNWGPQTFDLHPQSGLTARHIRYLKSPASWRKSLRWGSRLMTSPRFLRWYVRRATTSPAFIQWFLWGQILLGWILATLFAAGVTGLIRK